MAKLGTMLQAGRAFGMRDGMMRLRYELQRGSGLMSWKMRSVEGWDSWELKRICPGVRGEDLLDSRRDATRKFLFGNVRDLRSSIKKAIGPDGEQSIIEEAENILAGNLPFFGDLSYACEFPPRWFENPVSGQRVSPQQRWTEMRFASNVYGDLKFILEPSRFLFAYPLIRAYALSGDERFPEAFWIAVENWAEQSAPISGPLWICGQECSLRILSWSFALHAFIHSPSTTPERVAMLCSMIAAHSWRVAQTISYARSQRSNHLISEAVGLWTAGMLYPELTDARIWQNLGADLLHEAVLDQITPEGVSHQHSFNYQRMILHLLLWTLRLSDINNASLSGDIRDRTKAAFDFMCSWVDPISGRIPNFGSDDGSLIFPLASGAYRDYRPLLQLGAAVLDLPGMLSGPWNEAALWFGMKLSNTERYRARSTSSVETGYFRLGDDSSWALIRAGKYARRPFQADQLHVDLWWQGINLARDAGTYLYNGPAPWNNAFAGTAVHNTVTVNRKDQMRRAGRFLWLEWAQASGRLSSSKDERSDRFEGGHDGYRCFGVKHRRSVQWLAGAVWLIVDDLEGTGEHDLRLHWLTADLPYEVRDSPFQVAFQSNDLQIRWSIFASAPAESMIVRAGKRMDNNRLSKTDDEDVELLGWEASTYGNLRPAVSLVYDVRSLLPVRFVTAVLTDERWNFDSKDQEVFIFNRDHSEQENGLRYRASLRAGSSHAELIETPSMRSA